MFYTDACFKNVAIYTRVSSEHEEQIAAMENQKDWYSSILNNHPEWKVSGMYSDEGVTGTSALKRQSFMTMMRDAMNGKFNLILTREVSRFARNTVDTLKFTRELKRHMVEVYFISDGIRTFDPDGELRLSIMATLAQDESRKTSSRVKCGQQTSMEKGVVYGNGNVLGYDHVDGEYIVNPEQAEVVRSIFKWYAEGKGLKKIKWELEQRGMKTAMGRDKWCLRSISRVLRNPLYIGILTYHRQYTPDYLEQKKVVNHGEIPILQVQGKHEHIVSDELFFTVQERLEKKKGICGCENVDRENKIDDAGENDIWIRKLRCECGSRFCRQRWHTRKDGSSEYAYCCYSQVRYGTVSERKNRGISTEGICESSAVPDWKLQMMACSVLKFCIQEQDEVLGLVRAMLELHLDDRDGQKSDADQLQEAKQEMDELKKKVDRCVDLRIEGAISKDDFRKRKTEYEERMEELGGIIESLSQSVLKEKKVSENLGERVESLVDALKAEMDRYEGDEETHMMTEGIIDAFVDRIVVKKNEFAWYLRGCKADVGDGKKKGCRRGSKELPEMGIVPIGSTETAEDEYGYAMIKEMTITKEDAKRYLYSIDKRRRIIKWDNMKIDVFV